MIRKILSALKKDDRGVSALEYAILAGVIVVVVATGVTSFKGQIKTLFDNAGSAIDKAVTASKN